MIENCNQVSLVDNFVKFKLENSKKKIIRIYEKKLKDVSLYHKEEKRIKVEIFLIKNNIPYIESRRNGGLELGKFTFFTSTNRWTVFGKNIYYRSKGIESFIEKYYNKDKNKEKEYNPHYLSNCEGELNYFISQYDDADDLPGCRG